MSRITRRQWVAAGLFQIALPYIAQDNAWSCTPFDEEQLSLAKGWFTDAAFSRDGRYLLTAGFMKVAQLWDIETGKELRRFVGHTESLRTASFSSDEKYIVTAGGRETDMSSVSSDNSARVWEVATGIEVVRLAGHRMFVFAASFSPNGKYVLTTSRDGTASVWEVKSGELQFGLPMIAFHKPAIFSPDGEEILGIRDTDTAYYVQLWDANTGQELCQLDGHKKEIEAAHFSPTGRQVITASRDGTARTWDASSGRQLRILTGHRGPVNTAQSSDDERIIITASDDTTARIWDGENGKELTKLPHPGQVKWASVNRGGSRVATKWKQQLGPNSRTVVSLWDRGTGREIRQYPLPSKYGRDIALFTPDGKRLLTTSDVTTLWNADTGEPIRKYE